MLSKRRKRTANPSGTWNPGGGDAEALLVAGGFYRAGQDERQPDSCSTSR